MRQILPYLQPGARVLPDTKSGGPNLHAIGISAPDGTPTIVLVSQDWGPLDLTLRLSGGNAVDVASWSVTRTERGHLGERLGRVRVVDGSAQMMLPPRSITTLVPSGQTPIVDDQP